MSRKLQDPKSGLLWGSSARRPELYISFIVIQRLDDFYQGSVP
jgi:hypothetical protein